jgi:hypothetical protein
MPRDVKILILCDLCYRDGKEEDGQEYTITVNNAGPKVVIVCAKHGGIIQQLAELMALGFSVNQETTPAAARKAPYTGTRGTNTPGPYKCMYAGCPYPGGPTAGALKQHHRSVHNALQPDVYGNVCPLCNKKVEDLGAHANKGPHKLAGGAVEAFREAEQQGDPFGIVAQRRNALREAS